MREKPFHLHAKPVKRSAGRSVVAAAAYRAGDDLEHDGNKHLYSKRSGVLSAKIITPKGAPEWAKDRNTLWNKVEKSEKRKDAQLAREIVISLPHLEQYNDMDENDRNAILKDIYSPLIDKYIDEQFVSKGMVADVAIHAPSKNNDERNYHAHILLTFRKFDNDNFSTKKERTWNNKDLAQKWREKWSESVNRFLDDNDVDAYVDHRSYEERGLDIEPSKPLGHKQSAMEKKGIETVVGNQNRKILERNSSKYLERLVENESVFTKDDLKKTLIGAGYSKPLDKIKSLERKGKVISLLSKEDNEDTGLYTVDFVRDREKALKDEAISLRDRVHYPVKKEVKEKVVSNKEVELSEVISYVTDKEGFKVVEVPDGTKKVEFLSAFKESFKGSGYDIVSVVRNKSEKEPLKEAGFKGILTYQDLFRRFGDRYKDARPNKKPKVILVDQADRFSPLQDIKLFKMAKKLDAKLVYIGTPETRGARLWRSMFSHYAVITAAKSIKRVFKKKADYVIKASEAFSRANVFEALSICKRRAPKTLNGFSTIRKAKSDLLNVWKDGAKKKVDRRFILTSKASDKDYLNEKIQAFRLKEGHIKNKDAERFSVSYKRSDEEVVCKEIDCFKGDRIQFQRVYRDHSIDTGMIGIIEKLGEPSIVKMDDGRKLEIDLNKYNGFDLGYAGSVISPLSGPLEQVYLFHTVSNGLVDAPIAYQLSRRPVSIFYNNKKAPDLEALSKQLLGKKHGMTLSFSLASEAYNSQKKDEKELKVEQGRNKNGLRNKGSPS